MAALMALSRVLATCASKRRVLTSSWRPRPRPLLARLALALALVLLRPSWLTTSRAGSRSTARAASARWPLPPRARSSTAPPPAARLTTTPRPVPRSSTAWLLAPLRAALQRPTLTRCSRIRPLAGRCNGTRGWQFRLLPPFHVLIRIKNGNHHTYTV
jgi:hypothetical protein